MNIKYSKWKNIIKCTKIILFTCLFICDLSIGKILDDKSNHKFRFIILGFVRLILHPPSLSYEYVFNKPINTDGLNNPKISVYFSTTLCVLMQFYTIFLTIFESWIFLELYFPLRVLISRIRISENAENDGSRRNIDPILIAVFPIRTRLPYEILLRTRRERVDLKLPNIKERLHAHATVTRAPPPPDCFRISSYLRECTSIEFAIYSAS